MTEPTVRPFADWLREQAGGRSHDDLSAALHDLVAAVTETGKGGSLTFTVTVAPLDDNTNVLKVSDKVKVSLPEFPRPASIFFPDRNGNLSRRDPNQLEFDSLREVPREPDHAERAAGDDTLEREAT